MFVVAVVMDVAAVVGLDEVLIMQNLMSVKMNSGPCLHFQSGATIHLGSPHSAE